MLLGEKVKDLRPLTEHKAARYLLTRVKEGSRDLDRQALHTYWGRLVSTYFSSHLTKESDRLIAMSGTAKAFQESSGDVYLAGLWKRNIHTHLAWRTGASLGAPCRWSSSYAPSWSWASIIGGQVILEDVPLVKLSLIKLIEQRIETEPPGGDPTGLLRSAQLDIRCNLLYYRLYMDTKTLLLFGNEDETECLSRLQSEAYQLHFDTLELVEGLNDLDTVGGMCMPLFRTDTWKFTHTYLLLQKVSDNMFARLGILLAAHAEYPESWMGKRNEHHITLI
ncbi:hypothetical protein PT974_04351 [Cladobotryum mycophilum]|uniref:Uncharacterized protein n=1 Tax=Cladobotryum mycophilum TaxID=491253 RepID=A0ABR0SUZ1_9HYPO